MDVTREKTGQAIEGAFSAAWLFGQKVANAFAPLILSLFLGTYGWVETTKGVTEQPVGAIEALRLGVSVIPAGIMLLAVIGLVVLYIPARRQH